MAQCTAPVRGHNSSAAAAACPACRYRLGRGYGYGGGYGTPSYSSYSSAGSSGSYGGGGGGSSSGGSRPRWSRAGSCVSYTPAQVQSLTPVREAVERVAVQQPDLRDCFLYHAWPDRQGAAKELDDALEAAGVKTWFSELDLGLGVPMMRTIDRGLANSRSGSCWSPRTSSRGFQIRGLPIRNSLPCSPAIALFPIVHETTYDELRNVSPLLASRTGLNTKEDTMIEVAAKIAELVKIWA
jgi:hypothetical protein